MHDLDPYQNLDLQLLSNPFQDPHCNRQSTQNVTRWRLTLTRCYIDDAITAANQYTNSE